MMLKPDENGDLTYACRTLEDGRHLCVRPLSFGKARLYLSPNAIHTVADNEW